MTPPEMRRVIGRLPSSDDCLCGFRLMQEASGGSTCRPRLQLEYAASVGLDEAVSSITAAPLNFPQEPSGASSWQSPVLVLKPQQLSKHKGEHSCL